MKTAVRRGAFFNDDVVRQQTIEAFKKNPWRKCGPAFEIGHLAKCVHAGIGPAGTVHGNSLGRHGG